jgi:nitrite reductase/ring-hydroxylating ferredoxin subunit
MVRLVRLCNLLELGPGDKHAVTVDGESILVANVDGRIYAVSNICTHEYAELVNGFLTEDAITCPLHLSRFKLETGETLNPPATKSLKTYKVVVERNEVYVQV